MEKTKNENQKTFSDLTNKSWFQDGNTIKVGDSFQKIISSEFQLLDVKEVLVGDPFSTWKIIITTDDKIHLLKSSRELK
ncbi:MAG: hypothetical protein FWC36_01465 [Spirochaetes bacterium]|nr:hypothetical protein [Spirochaetota bacterium]